MSCVKGETQATIAEKLGVSRQYITKTLKAIREKCQRYITANHSNIRELFDALAYKAATMIPKAKRKDAGYAKHKVAYPTEYLMQISITGQWSREKYRLCNRCVVPEYFEKCFGDNNTKCTLCGDDFGGSTCSRLDVNKDPRNS